MRKTAVTELITGFFVMSPEKQDQLLFMVQHSCKMHLVSNFATAADKGLAAFENAITKTGTNPFAFASSESGALRLIKTSCKAFCARGCDKSGVHQFFEPHLHDMKPPRQLELTPYLGHRFNISFTNGAGVIYHLDDMTSFFERYPNPNNLLQCISFDIRQKVFIAGCRAYGIMAKKVTEPFLKLVKSKNILGMNEHLERLKETHFLVY